MTKKQAHKDFMKYWEQFIIDHPKHWNDKIMKAEEWAIYIDSLYKSDRITLKQYETWDTP